MGFLRDIGATLSFGAMETTKAKEARERYTARYERHEERHGKYENFVYEVQRDLEKMMSHARLGREAINETGAISVDEGGNIQQGWLNLEAARKTAQTANGEVNAITGAAGTIATAIGAPAAAWAAVGALGTASTGAAIGGLSGAAATSATAAWFGGGAVAAGGLGMAAAPFALTGMGLLAAAPMLGIGFWKSRQRERERLEAIATAEKEISDTERKMTEQQRRLEAVLPQVAPILERLESTTKDTKSANSSRLASIELMRTTLTAEALRVAELAESTAEQIDKSTGTREEMQAIADQASKVTEASRKLSTEASRQQENVNGKTERTTENIEQLAEALEDAEQLIRKANGQT